jgi:hypothetical protein
VRENIMATFGITLYTLVLGLSVEPYPCRPYQPLPQCGEGLYKVTVPALEDMVEYSPAVGECAKLQGKEIILKKAMMGGHYFESLALRADVSRVCKLEDR